MTGVDVALLVGLCVVLAATIGNLRAWGWLLACAASYTASVMYWRTGLPYGAFIAGMCDALVCLALYFLARFKWEMGLWRLFQFSVLVNIVYLGGQSGVWPSPSHNDYSIILEAVNWIALLWIGGNGALQTIGATDALSASGSPLRRLRRSVSALYRDRKAPPFTRAGR